MNRAISRTTFVFTSVFVCAALLAALASCAGSPSIGTPADQASLAERQFQQGIDRAPTPDTLYAMARILAAQGREAECQSVLQRIIHDAPNYMPAYNDLAELHMRQRKLDQAIDTLQIGLKVAPRQAVLINNLGMCRMLQHEYGKALDEFTRAAGIAPDDTRFRANMAAALGMDGRYDEALALYMQIGSPADAHFNIAVLAEARKDQARADEEYNLAILTAGPGDERGK